MSAKRILVTGANGFLANSLLKALSFTEYSVLTTDSAGNVDYCGDLADSNFVSQLPSVEIVIHCAAVQYVSKGLPFFARKQYFQRNNVTVAENLVSKYSGKVKLFINVGTSMMYDTCATSPIEPSTLHANNGLYSSSKSRAWEIISKMNNSTSMMVPCIIAGPGRGGLFVDLITSIQNRNISICPGNGNNLTQMVHVEDAAELLVRIAQKNAQGIFNAGGSSTLSINDWISIIRESLNQHQGISLHIPLILLRGLSWATNYRLLAKEQVSMLKRDHVLDTSTSEELGWKPRYTNQEIIISTVKTFL